MDKDIYNTLKAMIHNYETFNDLISIVEDMISDERFSSETKNILFEYNVEFIYKENELLNGLNEVKDYLIKNAIKNMS